MKKKKVEEKTNDVEIIDFDDNIQNEKKVKNKKPIIFIIVGILLILIALFTTKFILDRNNNDKKNNIEEKNEKKSNIDFIKELNNIKNIKNYTYTNNINVYSKNEQDSIYKINNILSYNDSKYKIDKTQTIQNIEYKNTNYYTKEGNNFYEYLNDITSNTYIRNNIDEANYNSRFVFTKFIEYLLQNYKLKEEKIININDNRIIDIVLTTSIQILDMLSINDTNLLMDSNKLLTKNIDIELYFTENDNKIYEINFIIEDRMAYQGQIEGKIEYSNVSYKFSAFDKTTDIELPY